MAMKPRSKVFLEELPKHKNKTAPAAIAAGYSPSYAKDHPNRIVETALKEATKELIERSKSNDMSTKDAKKLMSDILGISQIELMNRLKYIAIEQDRDMGSALKVLAPLVREHGIQLDSDVERVTVPVLNIMVEKPSDLPLLEGSVEPLLPSTS